MRISKCVWHLGKWYDVLSNDVWMFVWVFGSSGFDPLIRIDRGVVRRGAQSMRAHAPHAYEESGKKVSIWRKKWANLVIIHPLDLKSLRRNCRMEYQIKPNASSPSSFHKDALISGPFGTTETTNFRANVWQQYQRSGMAHTLTLGGISSSRNRIQKCQLIGGPIISSSTNMLLLPAPGTRVQFRFRFQYVNKELLC